MLLRTRAPGRPVSYAHNIFLSRQHSNYQERSQYKLTYKTTIITYISAAQAMYANVIAYKEATDTKQAIITVTRNNLEKESVTVDTAF